MTVVAKQNARREDVDWPLWEALSREFPADQIEKLPKGDTVLDYVGHAGITMRLNEVDPTWQLEPAVLDERGAPVWDAAGGMWFRFTILGVTRWCYGDPGRSSGANAVKEVIGDALRNGAMRAGVATYLWSKSERADAVRARAVEAQREETAAAAVAAVAAADSVDRAREVGNAAAKRGVLDVIVDGRSVRDHVTARIAALTPAQDQDA